MDTEQQLVEAMLNAVVPFAEQMLEQHGEFFPYAAAMLASGELVAVNGYDGEERPSSAEVIAGLENILRFGASSRKYIATAIISDTRVIPPESAEKIDAIAIEIDSIEGQALKIFVPYTLKIGKISLGELFILNFSGSIFKF